MDYHRLSSAKNWSTARYVAIKNVLENSWQVLLKKKLTKLNILNKQIKQK